MNGNINGVHRYNNIYVYIYVYKVCFQCFFCFCNRSLILKPTLMLLQMLNSVMQTVMITCRSWQRFDKLH